MSENKGRSDAESAEAAEREDDELEDDQASQVEGGVDVTVTYVNESDDPGNSTPTIF